MTKSKLSYQRTAHTTGTHYRLVINGRTAGYVERTPNGWACEISTHGFFRAKATGKTRNAAVKAAIAATGTNSGGEDLIALRAWANGE